jgi:hypothetical protein
VYLLAAVLLMLASVKESLQEYQSANLDSNLLA